MGREVTYSVVPRKNLLKRDEPAKYYAQAKANGDIDVKEMSKRIERTCTVTRADVVAVLVALEETIVEGLERGEIVRLGDIGSFQIGIRSKGVEKEEEYNASHIKRAKVNFRPGVALTAMLPGLSFGKVGKQVPKKPAGEEEGEEGGDEPLG